jgi:signal transduction histidine kinase
VSAVGGSAERGDLAQLLHDLRSPLAIIEGFARLLAEDDGRLTAGQRADYARRIHAAATEMRRLVDAAGVTPPAR